MINQERELSSRAGLFIRQAKEEPGKGLLWRMVKSIKKRVCERGRASLPLGGKIEKAIAGNFREDEKKKNLEGEEESSMALYRLLGRGGGEGVARIKGAPERIRA